MATRTRATATGAPQVAMENNSRSGGVNIGPDTKDTQQGAALPDDLYPPATTPSLHGSFLSSVPSKHGSPRLFRNSSSLTLLTDIDPLNLSDEFELKEYGGPVLTTLADSVTKVAKRILHVKTFRTHPTTLRRDPTLLRRRNLALELGANGFAKDLLLDARAASRKLLSSAFGSAFAILATAIASVEVAQLLDNGAVVYRLQEALYSSWRKQLDDLCNRAKAGYEVFNTPMPSMPTWGWGEDPLAFYAANEFEILVVCYGAEVENYLANLEQYFNFATNEIRSPDEEIRDYYDQLHRNGSGQATWISGGAQTFPVYRSFAPLRPANVVTSFSRSQEASSRNQDGVKNVTSSDSKSSTASAKLHHTVPFDAQDTKYHHSSAHAHGHLSRVHSNKHDPNFSFQRSQVRFSGPSQRGHPVNTRRQALAGFFFASKWRDKIQTRALREAYRDTAHIREESSKCLQERLLDSVYSLGSLTAHFVPGTQAWTCR